MQNKRKRLISLLFHTGRAMKEHFHGEKQGGISLLHMETMGYVIEHKNPTMKNVADHLCITPASASSLADGLVEEGFLERTFEKNDRRVVKLRITKKGKDFLKKSIRHANKQMEVMFSALDDKEVDFFIHILEKFTKGIGGKKTNNKLK